MTIPSVQVAGPFKLVRDGEIIPVNQLLPGRLRRIETYAEDPHEAPPGGGIRFKGYQRRAVTFLMEALRSYGLDQIGFWANGAAYYAQPGMGKTSTALEACYLMGLLDSPGVVVGPLQAQKTWCGSEGDPLRHFGLHIEPLDSSSVRLPEWQERVPSSSGPPWLFIHYEILDESFPALSQVVARTRPVVLIVDEIQKLGNSDADRTRATRALSGLPSIKHRIALTATPFRSSRMNLWSQLDIMQPAQWGTAHEFGVRYLGLQQERTSGGQIYWRPTGPTNTEELRSRLNGFTLKVSRGTAAAMGGTRIRRNSIWITLDDAERAEMQEAILTAGRKAAQMRAGCQRKSTVRIKGTSVRFSIGGDEDEAKKYPEKLVALTHTISAMADIKVRHAAKAALGLAQKYPRVIVFTERRASAKSIAEDLRRAQQEISILGPIDGAMPLPKRWTICRSVGDHPRCILVATAASIGVSDHSLGVATACLIATPYWNPDDNIQTEGRLLLEGDVVGEKAAIYLLIKDSPVDNRILELIGEKEEDTHDILGLGPDEEISADLVGGSRRNLSRSIGEIWDAISSSISRAPSGGAPGSKLLPAPENYLPYLLSSKDIIANKVPQAVLDALNAVSQGDDEVPVALARHPDLGWAILGGSKDAPVLLWSEGEQA